MKNADEFEDRKDDDEDKDLEDNHNESIIKTLEKNVKDR